MSIISNYSLKQRFHRHLLAVSLVVAGLASAAASQEPAATAASMLPSPERLSATFAQVTTAVEPAVVSIDTKARAPEIASRGPAKPSEEDILEFFRRQIPRRQSGSVGSGFIVDKSGLIITNAHVVKDASKITVKLDSGEELPATIVGRDEETDIAVIKIDAGRDLPVAKVGDSNRAKVGDWVLAMGSPFGLSRSVTAGIISRTNRETPQASVFQRFIQTDAAINRGNSGGPLVNMAGEVIGVNSQIATSTGDYNGVGFALPSSDAMYVYEQIVKNGKVKRGFMGVNLESVKAEFAAVYGLKEAKGAIVTAVRADEPAGRAGLAAGDVIVEFNGSPIENALDLIGKVSSTEPSQSVDVVFLRENAAGMERKNTRIMLGERRDQTSEEEISAPTKLPVEKAAQEARPFGLTLLDLTPTLAATYKLQGQKGVLVKDVSPESFIADIRVSGGDALTEGDLIQRINRVPVTEEKAFTAVVNRLKKGDAVVLHVLTGGAAGDDRRLKIVQFTVQ